MCVEDGLKRTDGEHSAWGLWFLGKISQVSSYGGDSPLYLPYARPSQVIHGNV